MDYADSLLMTFIAYFLAIVMTWFNWRFNKNIIYLTAFVVIQSFSFMMLVFFTFGTDKDLYAVLFYNFYSLFFLQGPLLYFFVRGMIKNKLFFRKKDWWHFLPAGLKLIDQIPYLFSPYSYKYQISSAIMTDFNTYKHLDLLGFYPQSWDYIFKHLHQLIYVVVTLLVLYKYLKRNKSLHTHGFKVNARWMTYLLFIIFFISAYSVYIGVVYHQINLKFYEYPVYQTYFITIILLFLSMILLFTFYPKILYGITFRELVPVQAINQIELPGENQYIDINERFKLLYQNLKNVSPENSLICKQIIEVFETEKPFLKKDFHMTDLTRTMKLPKHKLQSCICEELKINFADLKTIYRVKTAIELLKYDDNFTQDYVCSQSGFASESNFYTSFKKFTGLTPMQWKKQKASTE